MCCAARRRSSPPQTPPHPSGGSQCICSSARVDACMHVCTAHYPTQTHYMYVITLPSLHISHTCRMCVLLPYGTCSPHVPRVRRSLCNGRRWTLTALHVRVLVFSALHACARVRGAESQSSTNSVVNTRSRPLASRPSTFNAATCANTRPYRPIDWRLVIGIRPAVSFLPVAANQTSSTRMLYSIGYGHTHSLTSIASATCAPDAIRYRPIGDW